jgi:exosortase/archaeosortase family protein
VDKKSNNILSSLKVAAPLLWRAVAFLMSFVVLSGVIGPKIISHNLVSKDGFQIYGGAGKALLFGVVALSLLVWRAGLDVILPRWKTYNLIWFGLALISAVGAWFGVDKLIADSSGMAWPVFTHLCLLASIAFAALGSFGPACLRRLFQTYKRQMLIALVLAVAFYGFLYVVYGLWTVLAAAVLHSVSWLLSGIGLHSMFIPPRTLMFSKFGIQVAEYCSGIESIALFSALYLLVGILDWSRFDKRKYMGLFLPALLILFGFNILRVAVLILAGYYINPQIAFSLFHTYAGMVFFILYSLLFWAASYKWMIRKQAK